MSFHVVEINNPAKITVDLGRIKINDQTIAARDVAVLVLNHPEIVLSAQTIALLGEHGAVVISVNSKHIPIAITLPYNINLAGAKNPHLQAIHLSTAYPAGWWQKIVAQKIENHGFVMKQLNQPQASEKLLALRNTVTPGDKTNVEGLAAKIFWQDYFDSLQGGGNREKQHAEQPLNKHLNYGYAIVRSLLARAFAAAGFCCNFGVGHHRQDNPFNLVEDFMEPYRYIAEWVVAKMFRAEPLPDLTPASKKQLVTDILAMPVPFAKKNYRLIPATEYTANNYAEALATPEKPLDLPCPLAWQKITKPR